MVLTRTEGKAVFDHILDVVLDRYGSGDMKSALVSEGFVDIFSLLSIDDATIETLEYEDPNDASKKLVIKKSDKGMLRTFKAFVTYRITSGNPINDEDWMNLTVADFDAYRVDPANLARLVASTPPPLSTRNNPGPTKYSMVDLFRRGIKRDPSLFPTLKDEKYNDSWHRSFETQARAQDVFNVLVLTTNQQLKRKKNCLLSSKSICTPFWNLGY
jgi:hypothetical protein